MNTSLQKFLAPGLCALALTVGAGMPVQADVMDMSLEELMNIPVKAASGFEQDTSEAPAAVTIVTRQDIQAFGYRTLADALASVAGFYPNYDRTYQYAGVRGFSRPGDYNTRLLVLVNGVRVNDPIYNTGQIGTDFPVDLDLVERIEVVRGPSSSLYGSSAFLGVVNVITRSAQDVAPAEMTLAAGSHDAYSGRFSYGQAWSEKASLLVSGSLLARAGEDLYFPAYDQPENNRGVAEGNDGQTVGSFFLQGRADDLSLQVVHMDRTKERPTAAFGTIFDDPAAEDRDRETMADLTWDSDWAPQWHGLARLGWQQYEYQGLYPYEAAAEGDPPVRRVDTESAVADSIRGEARVDSTVVAGHRLSVGAEIRHAYRLDLRYESPGEAPVAQDETQTELGCYLQDEWRLAAWALANAGLRYDRQEPSGDDRLSPRAALILAPAPETTLKLIYSEAFRSPSVYERYYDDAGVSTKANPALEPEVIRMGEIVWEQELSRRLRLNLSVFRSAIEGIISQTLDPADGLLVLQNLDAADAWGGDAEAIATLPGDAQLRASYSYCRATDRTTGEPLSNSPEHLAKLGLQAPLVPGWVDAGLEAQYVSSRLTVDGATVDGAVLVNGTLLSRKIRNLELAFSVYNLFDVEYAVPVGEEIAGGMVAQDGRSFLVKATVHF